MKTVLVLCMIAVLAGCGSAPVKPNPVILEPEKKTVVVPPELLTECTRMTKLDRQAYPEGDTVDVVKAWSVVSNWCADNNHALILLIKKAFNIP